MILGTEIRAHKAPWNDAVELLIVQRGHGDTWAVAQPIVMEQKERHGYVEAPSLSISDTAAQQLMDNLWTIGFRPSEGTGSAGALAATQKHLEDMRKLVFEVSGSPSIKHD